MEEEKGGITLGEIFRTIWSQKWIALAVLLVITIAGTFILKYAYGANKEEYITTYSINLSTAADGRLEYPDGSRHNYLDFVSYSNLKAAKESDEVFSDVNIESMSRNGDISISQNRTENGPVTYTVRVKAKYFNSKETATEFLSKIAETPSREICSWAGSLAAVTEYSFNEKRGNEQKLDYLKSQLNAISERFASLGGITDAAKQKVNNLLLTATALTGELHTNYYEPDDKALEEYGNLVSELKNDLQTAQAVLDNLKGIKIEEGTPSGDMTVIVNGADIVTYAEKVATLTQRINVYEKYIENNPDGAAESENSKNFTVKMTALLADIQSLTSTVESRYYENNSLVSYSGAPVSAEGGFGFVKSGLISLVIGLIVALIVAYTVGWAKNDKAAKVVAAGNSSAADDGSAGEVEAQVAAVDVTDVDGK